MLLPVLPLLPMPCTAAPCFRVRLRHCLGRVVPHWVTLPVVLLSSTLCNYYSTISYSLCYSQCCLCYPCRAQPPPASESGCVAVWAGWCHLGFIQRCCFTQTIALSPDHFAGSRRNTCICTRSHGARDHLARERMMSPRSPRASMMVKPLGLYVVVRDVVAGVRCALQKLIAFAPAPPLPPTTMRREHGCVKPVAGKTAGAQVPRVVGIDLANIASSGGGVIFAATRLTAPHTAMQWTLARAKLQDGDCDQFS